MTSIAPAEDGAKLSPLADVSVFWVSNYLVDTKGAAVLDLFPALESFRAAFAARPEVARYYASDRAFPLCRFQLGSAPPEYKVENYLYEPPLAPSVYAEPWTGPPPITADQ